jgi:hypothetical protein
MKPAPFDYHRPDTAAEAVGLLAELALRRGGSRQGVTATTDRRDA